MLTELPRLKVAIFHFGFFYSGGGEKLVLEEVKGLRALGHEVTCFAPYVNRESCFPDVPEMSEVVSLLPPPPKWLPLQHAIWVLACCVLIPLISPRFQSFDVFFGANQPGPWFAYVLSKILNKPYVIYLAQPLRLLHPRKIDTVNGLRIHDGDQRFVRILTRIGKWFINWADRVSVQKAKVILTNGLHVSHWIREIYSCETRSCPAGCYPLPEESIDYDNRWDGKIRINGLSINQPFILLTNRHTPQKRFEYALWALKKIKNEIHNLSLVITGQETEYTNELRYLVETLNLENRVQFVGLVTEDDLAELYRKAALYVYPAPEEDFGMGIIEAMAAGTPVVAWNRGGPTYTVKDGETGFLITPYETDEFAEKIKLLASEPLLVKKMGRAAHKRAKDYFSYDRHYQILEEALFEAIDAYTINIEELDKVSPQTGIIEELEEQRVDQGRYS